MLNFNFEIWVLKLQSKSNQEFDATFKMSDSKNHYSDTAIFPAESIGLLWKEKSNSGPISGSDQKSPEETLKYLWRGRGMFSIKKKLNHIPHIDLTSRSKIKGGCLQLDTNE